MAAEEIKDKVEVKIKIKVEEGGKLLGIGETGRRRDWARPASVWKTWQSLGRKG